MTKYNIEDKKKYIELIKSGRHSVRSAAKEAGVSKSVGERWWKTYESLGLEGLIKISENHSQNYSSEFKLNGIKYKQYNHLSFNQAAANLGISATTLARWEQIYLEEGEEGLAAIAKSPPSKAMKNKESKLDSSTDKAKEELIIENERLRVEIAYLKKCIALAQKKKKLQAKKRQ